MIRRLIVLTSLLCIASLARADFVGVYGGAGYWYGDFSGDVIQDVSVDGDLNLGNTGANYIYVAVEHPIPLIPNVRIARTQLKDSGRGTLTGNFRFEGADFTNNQQVSAKVDLTHNDFTLYYEVVDVGFDLDIGLTARQFDGEVSLDNETEDLDFILPMAYLSARVDLPFTGTYLSGHINGIAYSGNSVIDYSLALGWQTENFIFPEFGVEAGYRNFSLEVDEDVEIDMEIDGVFVNLVLHF